MSERQAASDLIAALAADLRPVRRLPRPSRRTLLWCGAVLLVAAAVYGWSLMVPVGRASRTDLPVLLGEIASAATALATAIAAFELSLPDRSGRWAWLPVPPLVAWLAIAGIGCLKNLGAPGVWGTTLPESAECLLYILAISLPVSALLIIMLRRARPLRPTLVALMAGLASAGVAATLLILVHPHDSAALDLLGHLLAVAAVIGLNAVLGGRLLSSEKISSAR